jgi:hypothetical protein
MCCKTLKYYIMLNNKIIIIQYNHIIIIRLATTIYLHCFKQLNINNYNYIYYSCYLEIVKKTLSSMEVSKLREFILQYKVYNIYI